MKFAIVILAVVAAASAQYNPFPGQYNPGQYNAYKRPTAFPRYTTPTPFRPFVSSTPAPTFAPTFVPSYPTPVPQRIVKYNGDAQNANIVKYENEVNPDGSYAYAFETDNGIAAQEQGAPKSLGGNPPVAPVVAQGSFSYTSPEGQPIVITYIADENGFQPQGDSLPVGPAIPEYILRSLEYNARNAPKQ